jgi:endonuclease YncB( thermonuclease family)
VKILASAALAALVLSGGALGQEVVTGPAKVVDGDIIMVGRQRVILWAIDAPERTQRCHVGELLWDCYAAARQQLGDLIATGETSCTLTADQADQFGRRHGTCISVGKDVGGEMVRAGMARAYVAQGEDYIAEEAEARAAQVGVFQPGAKVDDPWEWRKRDPRNYR